MNDFQQMHIFFFVATIAAVVFGLLFAVLLGYLIKISTDIKYISRRAREEADLLSEDLSELRDNVKERGAKLKYFLSFFTNIYKNHNKKGK